MKRRISIVIMAVLLIISFVVPVFAASRTLGVSEIDQNKTKCCWAAW